MRGRQMSDITGLKFNRLTVISLSHKANTKYMWTCKCDCGNVKIIMGDHLRSGKIKSCGCYNKEIVTTHGMTKTKFYRVWKQIKIRCNPKYAKNFPNYCGRGISMCKEWLHFENFYKDMFDSYIHGLVIDRIDNNGNYCKENCRWVTRIENSNNKRTNVLIKINGEIKTIAEWARFANLDDCTLHNRITKQWPEDQLLIKPKSRKLY